MTPAATKRVDWTIAAFAAALAYGVYLAAMFVGHFWLKDAHGAIIANDFIVFQAGRLVRLGHGAMAYDWQADHAAEVAAAGHAFAGNYPWSYPPPFLFVAGALTRLPHLVAFAAWVGVTLAIYAMVVARIAGRRDAWLFACAFPAVLLNMWVGQNGFVSAALIGGTLLLMEDRPLLSGICLGLLTYKPQFGILFPFVLLAGGEWRVIASAAATALVLAMASLLMFGAESWIAFFHSLPLTAHVILDTGQTGWNKLQNIYGLVRWLGGGNAAWVAQGAMLVGIIAALIALWRRKDIPFALKASALATGTLLATPYSYIYDFPALAVAIAFLFRHRPFDRREITLIAMACICIAIFPWANAPTGLASALFIAAIVSRRLRVLWRAKVKLAPPQQAANAWVVGAAAIVFGYIASLALLFVRHAWIIDAGGHPKVTDFLEVWAAGLSVLKGAAAAPYDWQLHHAAQVAVVGHPFAGFLGWHYPPLFLFVAAGLALLPYAASFIAWDALSAALFASVIAKIAQRKEAALFALILPACFGNALVGQNGFLTAAIVGAILLTLETKPVVAGLFLALLTYKPQFGLMFPLVLLAQGNWRALVSAAGFTALLCGLCWLVFGTAPFAAFFGHLPSTSQTILGFGTAGFEKMQSVFGLLRWLGMDERAAWIGHGAVALSAAIALIWLWRRDVPYALKASALAAMVLIATPYLYMYDFPLLALPFVFLFRHGRFDRVEIGAAIAVNILMLVFAWSALPIGPVLVAVPVFLLVRRVASILPAHRRDVALQRA
jgi:hypothetical protein